MDIINRPDSPQDSLLRILDYTEVIKIFRIIFPILNDDVIEAVLSCNKGDVILTVDQLLTMSSEFQTDLAKRDLMSCDDESGLLDAKPF
ncbi:UBA-like,Ubiquitin system component Cue [Cinara cedri]|uniref:UBA-like,Ubiquitin system component Cue n=1 Tax=Cinara cedri TaxID=506608 RepID=A0A5E4NHH6_9HEMI|nr:UBA-like,Ubiquitin system component Cue [Cinara cedri]